jgi:hypothetical protein
VIVTLAAGRDLTRAEMIDILLAAGYRESSAVGRMSSSHPLFRRIGPDRYRLVGDEQSGESVGLVGAGRRGGRDGDHRRQKGEHDQQCTAREVLLDSRPIAPRDDRGTW